MPSNLGCMLRHFVLSSLLLTPLVRVDAFNVGTSGARVVRGDTGTYFGSTLHFLPKDSGLIATDDEALLISAPKHETPSGMGVVQFCTDFLGQTPNCHTFRRQSDEAIQNSSLHEQFGFAVAANKDGTHVICSPQWTDTKWILYYYLFKPGRCTIVPSRGSKQTAKDYTPFYHPDNRGYITPIVVDGFKATLYNDGVALYGFSVDSTEGQFFVAGAPGVLEGEGTVVLTDWGSGTVSKIDVPVEYNIDTTAYGYLGYDIKIGKFCSDSDICFAASAPNMNQVGVVKIFKVKKNDLTTFNKIQMIEGKQSWSYFGYSLAVCDVNGDGWDELVIGAPHESDTSSPEGHDQGRVYVYGRTNTNEFFQRQITLEGSPSKFARFGTTVQCIGDINLDDYMDVAVGAPNEDDGAGSVHIYLGSATGLINPASQRITPSSLPTPINGLGYAISGSKVLPGSSYPIFAVSSILDDAVVILNTRKVVVAQVSLTANPNSIDVNKPCDDVTVSGACFEVKLCMSGKVRGGGTWDNMFKVKLDIDTKRATNRKRALFWLPDGSSKSSLEETVDTSTSNCVLYKAVVIEAQVNQDRFSPVVIEAHFSLASSTEDNTTPVLDKMAPQSVTSTAMFKNDCGENKICDVNLGVTGKLDYTGDKTDFASIVVNGTKELLVDLIVVNKGETNYWTVVEISVDSPLLFSRSTPSSDRSVLCQAVTHNPDNTAMNLSKVICNHYQPLKSEQAINVGVAFDTFDIPLDKEKLTVKAEVMPKNLETSREIDPADDTFEQLTDVRIIADVTVHGVSSPTEMTIQNAKRISVDNKADINDGFIVSDDTEDLHIAHKFLVRNEGPSFLLPTKVQISVPFFLLDASRFVYAFDVQITYAGKVSVCRDLINFDSIQRVIATTTTSKPTTDSRIEEETTSKIDTITDAASEPTTIKPTIDRGGLPPITPNRRKRRSLHFRKKRSAVEITQAIHSNIYIQSCQLDPSYCQIFECDLSKGLNRDEYAEVNVSLVVDKRNIPVPDGLNTFWYEVRAKVVQPQHKLMQRWEDGENIEGSVTKFHLVESGGKINILVIIGSIIGGLVVITIVALILWKAGFFKRNKHHQVAQWKRESQRRSRYSAVPKTDGDDHVGKNK